MPSHMTNIRTYIHGTLYTELTDTSPIAILKKCFIRKLSCYHKYCKNV